MPLANAWRLGADTWDTATRKAFANDLGNPQLIAVPAASNRSKGDQSPDRWSPPVARLLVHVLPGMDPHQARVPAERHRSRA
ncbi:hypothetical protein [Streptomyces sp. NBC_00272]|uniref:hypothetical protein n=1 Tax=Streptomyces sp. NBC_00272 TaxID=2975698 RepID=UPI003FA6EFF8